MSRTFCVVFEMHNNIFKLSCYANLWLLCFSWGCTNFIADFKGHTFLEDITRHSPWWIYFFFFHILRTLVISLSFWHLIKPSHVALLGYCEGKRQYNLVVKDKGFRNPDGFCFLPVWLGTWLLINLGISIFIYEIRMIPTLQACCKDSTVICMKSLTQCQDDYYFSILVTLLLRTKYAIFWPKLCGRKEG